MFKLLAILPLVTFLAGTVIAAPVFSDMSLEVCFFGNQLQSFFNCVTQYVGTQVPQAGRGCRVSCCAASELSAQFSLNEPVFELHILVQHFDRWGSCSTSNHR
jgi:hypothetical protein